MTGPERPLVHVSLIGGQHQFLHIIPVAAELAASGLADVVLFVGSQSDGDAAQAMARALGADKLSVQVMALPFEHQGARPLGELKILRLLRWSRALLACDILLTAERTSTILRRLPIQQPLFAHIPHGAGDRAKGFEKRLSRFDHIIVAGDKDRRRMLAEGVARDGGIWVSGYIKTAALRRLRAGQSARLFANERPVILYNPHFSTDLSSWRDWGRAVVEDILASGRYNLIVAPHMRLFKGADATAKAPWLVYANADNCIVDLGSERLTDMTYTDAADIYLGDVSSQIYEFQSRPRPCVFLNAHGVEWRNDADYRMWDFGEVVDALADVVNALDRATSRHAEFIDVQRAAIIDALGPMADEGDDAITRAADIIAGLRPNCSSISSQSQYR